MSQLVHYLIGKTRAALLSELLLHPDTGLQVRELARLTQASPGSLHRELNQLVRLGLVNRSDGNRQVLYFADKLCPIYDELAGLLRKTVGLADVLRQALAPNSGRIEAAFVYGSIASGQETTYSDVDVMVLGSLSFADAVVALAPAQETLRREVNATVMKPAEFARKRQAKDGFVTTVWKAPKLWLMGGEDELGKPG